MLQDIYVEPRRGYNFSKKEKWSIGESSILICYLNNSFFGHYFSNSFFWSLGVCEKLVKNHLLCTYCTMGLGNVVDKFI